MILFQAAVLAIVQGLTEFIPVSSSGHLVLVPWAFGWDEPGVSFDVLLHFGTLIALLVYFRSDLIPLLAGLFSSFRPLYRKAKKRDSPPLTDEQKLAWLIVIGTIPAGVLGGAFTTQVESLFGRPAWAGLFLCITGIFLFVSSRWKPGKRGPAEIGLRDALLIGLAQAVAIAPGISRSGMTIGVGLMAGLERSFAPRFAFLLSIPAIAGATLYQSAKIASVGVEQWGWPGLLLGLLVAAAAGYLAIGLVMRVVGRGRLEVFGYYCLLVGAAVLAYAWWRG